MCGIAGIVTDGRVHAPAVTRMNALLQHRGPDGEGVWASHDGRCVLGHRRLAIIDLTADGHQPMRFGHLVITYNGEIYNYLEVRKKLVGLGRAFRSASDTEVLLQAFEQWGPDCLHELNGMFAFAIWNDETKTLFCARDRFGEKPFLYSSNAHRFAFASEAKALAVLDDVDLSISDPVLASYFIEGSTAIEATEQTLLRGIRQLMPGHAMLVRLGVKGLQVERTWCWWSIDTHSRHAPGVDDERTSAQRLLELLSDSVRLRLRSDVPVGSCLSGGLDSSAIVSLIRRLEPAADLRTFTGRFPGHPSDEGHYAKLVIEASKTHAFEVSPTPERFATEAERVYWHAELPIGGMSQFAQWCVFELASKNGVTVLLDGQGSDEVLGGYGNNIVHSYLSELASLGQWPMWLRERRVWAAANPGQFSWPKLLLGTKFLSPLRSKLRKVGGRPLVNASKLARHEWLVAAEADRKSANENATGPFALSRMLFGLSFRTMLSSLLRFGDRLSMAHSREVRLPFCDHRLAELAFSLSPELLVGGGEVKRVLRRAIDGLVPAAIVHRPKQGFVPPQQTWLTNSLTDWIRKLVDGAGVAPLDGRLDASELSGLVHADRAHRARESDAIWHVVNLVAWDRFALSRMRQLVRVPSTEA